MKKRSSGPTPLRQIRTQNREHKQSKHRQGQNHHHHGATLQTPLYLARRWPITPSSFSTTYPVTPRSCVSTARHTCHPTPQSGTPVLALLPITRPLLNSPFPLASRFLCFLCPQRSDLRDLCVKSPLSSHKQGRELLHKSLGNKKSSRQDRRRSDKYELNTEKTNNPNTARARIITTTGLPSKHPFTLQAAGQLSFHRFQPLNSPSRQIL